MNFKRECPAMPLLKSYLFACVCGAVCILGFAPVGFYPLSILGLAALFYLLIQAPNPCYATWLGFAFGLGFFSVGVSWVYVSLHDFGGMPFWMAGFFTFLFCAFLALFHAAFAYTAKRMPYQFLSLPVAWVLGEWIRSWIFTGFPWLNIGYAQVTASPLAGFIPIFGVYGTSLVSACVASLLAFALYKRQQGQVKKYVIATLVGIWVLGSVLKQLEWTSPLPKQINATLVQGNIPQQMKWQADTANHIMQQYFSMIKSTHTALVVLPESAMPVLWSEVPNYYIEQLSTHAKSHHGDILIGAIEDENNLYYNSVVSIGTSLTQSYRKSHLVPFGEFIPLKNIIGFIYRDWLNMPLSDLARGTASGQTLDVAGLKVAVNICYEDAFGEEIIRALPQASVLINSSNMAWFGNSWAADQHLQMSQARALETGRMMLRATNTGATAVINHHGEVLAKLPYFKTATLEATIQPYTGSTPYVRWGNWPVLLLLLCYCLFSTAKAVLPKK